MFLCNPAINAASSGSGTGAADEPAANDGTSQDSPSGEDVGAAAEAGISPTVGELRAAGEADAHHIIQDAAARDVPGYKTNAAPGIPLEGPSTESGTPHNEATQIQRTAGVGGTYEAERQVACLALTAAGCSPAEIADALARADAYFMGELGLTYDSRMRIPGNRQL
jgi:hypothetical protein